MPDIESIEVIVASLIKVLLKYDQSEIIEDICWALCNIADGGTEYCALLLSDDLIARLITLMDRPEPKI